MYLEFACPQTRDLHSVIVLHLFNLLIGGSR